MDNNARVKIQVDDSRVKELRQSAAELYDKFAKNAREQAKDLRDVNRHISEQIRLLETRNQKANALRRQELEAEFKGGAISAREYKSNLKGLEANRSYYTAQVRSLRDMLESDMSPGKRARELYSEIASSALGTRGDVGSSINEKIRQFERQSRIDQSQREFQLRSRYDQGYLSREQYHSGLRSIQADKRGDALLIKLLREIADNTKNDAKNSAEELVKRLRVSSRDDASTWIARLEGKRTGSATDIMRRQEAANLLRVEYGLGGIPSTGGGGFGGILASGAASLAGGSRLGSLLTRFGPAGLAIGATIGAGAWGFNRYQEQAAQARNLAVYHGLSLRDARSMVSGWNLTAQGLGLSTEEFASKMAGYERSAGRWYSPRQVTDMFSQQRALGLDDATYNQMLRLGRQGRGGSTPGLIDALARRVSRQYGGLTRLPDALEYFSTAAQNVLSVKGTYNQNALAGIVSSLMANGVQGSQMNRILGGIQNIGSNANPLAQGLAYRAAAMLNPNASTWDLMKMVESPLDNTPFLREYLKQAKSLSGGDVNQEKFLLKGVTGLSANDVEELYRTLASGTDASIDKKVASLRTGYGGGEGNLPRANELTTEMEKFSATLDKIKDEVVNGFLKMYDATVGSEGVTSAMRAMMDENRTTWERIVAGLVAAGGMTPSPMGFIINQYGKSKYGQE